MKNRMTLKEIAAQLNISLATVDRAVNNRVDINPRTREIILQKIKEVEYKPNKIARSLVLKKDIKVGVVLLNSPNFFWSEVERGIRYIEGQFKDFGIKSIYYRTGSSAAEQKYAIEQLLNEEVRTIIIKPKNNKLIVDKLNECIKNGINIVTVNEDLKDVERMFYVGPQDIEAGRTAGELMARFAKSKGKVAVVASIGDSNSYNQRYQGFCQQLREMNSEVEVIDWTQELIKEVGDYNAYFITKHYIKTVPDLIGIYNNSGVIYEIGLAVKDEVHMKGLIVIGHEISPEITELMNQDCISAIISQDPFSQGYYAMKLLCDFMMENSIPEFNEYFTRIDIIIKSSLQKRQNIINSYVI